MASKLGVTIEDFEKLIAGDAAVSLVSLNKVVQADSYKDVHEIDILENKKAEDPTHPEFKTATLMRLIRTPVLNLQRTPHHHSLLLRRRGDERNQGDARPDESRGQMHSRLLDERGQTLCSANRLVAVCSL